MAPNCSSGLQLEALGHAGRETDIKNVDGACLPRDVNSMPMTTNKENVCTQVRLRVGDHLLLTTKKFVSGNKRKSYGASILSTQIAGAPLAMCEILMTNTSEQFVEGNSMGAYGHVRQATCQWFMSMVHVNGSCVLTRT
jgi:hypothetical protein